jgi:EAL domain-containing protein (putative c-di-GMP-specific phosphodiesterase class I)
MPGSTRVVSQPTLPDTESHIDIPAGIREVLGGKGLTVQFQPIFDLGAWLVGTKRAVGYEALARFDLPVAPDIWFREAARMGLGAELELAAIRTAVSYLPQIPAGAFLTVNISPETASSLPNLDWFHRLPLRRVVIEISEEATIDNYEAFRHALDGLRARGLRVAVDDVGAGLASLKHLVMLPHDIIKLDLDVVRDVDTDHNCQAMVAALLALARARDTQVIAEGIETSNELVSLVDLGVGYGQGFHLAHPGPLPQPAR